MENVLFHHMVMSSPSIEATDLEFHIYLFSKSGFGRTLGTCPVYCALVFGMYGVRLNPDHLSYENDVNSKGSKNSRCNKK